jgi:MarR family transcriptional regulator, organic hydroperoxide resistance regulator
VDEDEVARVLAYYPQIYYACHARHRREPESRKVISERQASILDHLAADTTTTLKELAQHLGVTASTMSLSVDRLVEGGWVERAKDAQDARRAALRLTEAGARMKDARTVLDPQRVRAVLDRLGPAERQAALAGLELLAQASVDEVATWSKGKGD